VWDRNTTPDEEFSKAVWTDNFRVNPLTIRDPLHMYLHFLKYVISSGDPQIFSFIVRWQAYCIQNPGKKTNIMLNLLGEEGIGKTAFANIFGSWFVDHYANMDGADRVASGDRS
jgi:hypothetical protein